MDLDSIVTPLNVKRFEGLLKEANYDEEKTRFLVDGFTNGFDIGYDGPMDRQSEAENIPFTPGVGDKYELWNKIMKEVEAKRYAGPFDKIPFDKYIQSPVGLVPKAGGKTRLIFHLSFKFSDNETGISLNEGTPHEICTMKYNDLDEAIHNCLCISKEALKVNGRKIVFLGKPDLSSTFRVLPLMKKCFCLLVLKAVDPTDGKTKYFVDKCLPFGASISCALYQKFSDELRFIMEYKTNRKAITNYLDDFLFVAITKWICDQMLGQFIEVCTFLNIPIALEKTEWATTCIIFLGILLNGEALTISIPLEKQKKALNLLNEILDKKKITIKQIQVLTGYLNFLTKAIVLGRTFTRKLYAKLQQKELNKQGKPLKSFHHIKIDQEMRFDCEVWRMFLDNFQVSVVCRPMIDVNNKAQTATQLDFYSDASANERLGFGAVFNNQWLHAQWENNFIKEKQPSIGYLELVGVISAVLTWGYQLKDRRVLVYCDNISAVAMINSMTSSCKNCMYLLRLLALNNMVNNRRVFARHVRGIHNNLSDALSRLQFDHFWRLAGPRMAPHPTTISPLVWPISRHWQD